MASITMISPDEDEGKVSRQSRPMRVLHSDRASGDTAPVLITLAGPPAVPPVAGELRPELV